MTREPTRLLAEGSAASTRLREILGAAAQDAPGGAELARLEARLQPLLRAPPGTLPVASAAKAATWKVVAAFVVGAGLAGIGVALRPTETPSRPAPAPAVAAVVEPASAPPPEPQVQVAAQVAAEPAAPSAAPVRRRARPRATVAAPPVSRVAETPDEAEILARAHAALRRGDAAAALVLTLEHEHAFPAGLLAQERDAIAIEGLVAVGRVEDAQARLRSFAARFPQSGYLWRLGTLVERNAGP